MNYKKIYDDLVHYCRKTTPKFRIMNRNVGDVRIQDEYLYTEKHHIIPRHAGGEDCESNLVVVLPEEHFLLHLLRYKWGNSRNDFLACRFMINGYRSKNVTSERVTSKMYGMFKHHIYRFRKEYGWHTEQGRKSISESRKNQIVVKDVKTGIVVGSYERNHPNILNGKWVHHTTGNVIARDINGNKVKLPRGYFNDNPECGMYKMNRESYKGYKNPNFKGVSEDDMMEILHIASYAIVDGEYLISKLYVEELNKKFFTPRGMKKISNVWINNHMKGMKNVVKLYNLENGTSIKYNPYYRSKSQKKLAAEVNKHYTWISNEKESIRVLTNDVEKYLKNGYIKGRAHDSRN